jgi:hypothetical protein
LLAELHQRAQLVGLEDRLDVLEDRRHALHAHAGVDALHGQLGERPVLVELVLHEDQVPVLEIALGVVAGTLVVAPERRPAIEVELRAGAARTGRPGLPEVVLATQQHDPLVGDADRAPDLDRLLVGAEPELLVAAEDRDPDAVRVEVEALRGQLPGVLGGALLEVVADGEVAEHLEEREVALGGADHLDVDRPEALLARGQPPRRRLLLAAEVGLERLHPRRGQQHRRVVDGRHQRCRGQAQMTALLEERQEPLADVAGLHGAGV